jgi:two-component sensor histidine kinase/CheY-like chemotaxis protein
MHGPDLSPMGEMSFLAGDSEMARLIRHRDWSAHPFGPPEGWPQSLRSALSICLHSAFPTAIYWGPELRLLYNDAWAPVPGPRHPAALGAPAREVWADIWHVIEPQFARLLASGEGVYVEDQMLPMRRYGVPEETYWSYSFTAIRGEDGTIAGVFNTGSETTRSVLGQRQMRILLELGETLRLAEGPQAGRLAAIAMLGEQLCVDRVGFAEAEPNGDRLAIMAEWTAPGGSPVGSHATLSDFGVYVSQRLRAGRTLLIEDVMRDRNVEPEVRGAFRALDVAAVAVVPWMASGTMAGVAYLHSARPRAWNDFDLTTVEELIERTRGWFERERAAERERIMIREVDHRARNALAVAQSVVRLTLAEDIGSFRDKIEQRIAALARAHGLLAAERWNAVDLLALVNQELSPYGVAGNGRVRVEGPAVPLPPDVIQTVALVLHELATNAAKYGALAVDHGRLALHWHVDASDVLQIDWTETIPDRPVSETALPLARGFGATLLERVVEAQLGGTISRELRPDGLRCRIAFPLAAGAAAAPPAAPAPVLPEAGRRVLIVEDEAILAMDLEIMVENLGHGVFAVCGSVSEAVAALDVGGLPDLAVLDANLRGESSLPVARRLHEAGVPVIFATGYDSVPDLPQSMAQLPRLAKPVTERVLGEALTRAFAVS